MLWEPSMTGLCLKGKKVGQGERKERREEVGFGGESNTSGKLRLSHLEHRSCPCQHTVPWNISTPDLGGQCLMVHESLTKPCLLIPWVTI